VMGRTAKWEICVGRRRLEWEGKLLGSLGI
jgi:hypothetical protein